MIGTITNKNLNNISLSRIDKITILGLNEKDSFELKNNLNVLKNDNLFFLDDSLIKKILDSKSFIEEYVVTKQYPSILTIKVVQTKILARFKKNEKNYYLGTNGKFINDVKIKYEVPFIFGDFKIKKLFELKNAIDQTNFNYNNIEKLFFFKSGRWDIETFDGLLIKLPKDEIIGSFELLIKILNENDEKKIKKIDFRQKNQVIIDG
jgi:cell division protein FtsQ